MTENAVTEVSDSRVMKITPTVSVVTVTYNHQAYLTDAIEGVLSQKTNFPFELIVGDDCSTDRTREIALDYQRRYPEKIRVLFSDFNVGAFYNSNRCFERVRGEFLAFCQGDDFWQNPLKLQKQVDYLRSHPECGMVHSDYDYLVHNFGAWRLIDAKSRPKRLRISQGNVYRQLLDKMFIRTCTTIGRTELLKKHFSSSLRTPVHAVGDRPIALHMSTMANIDYLDESLATYRRTPGSMTNIGHDKLLSQVVRKIDMYRSFFEEFGSDQSEWLEMQRICYRENLNAAFLAVNDVEFGSTLIWLKENDQGFAHSRRVQVMAIIIKSHFLCTALLKATRLYNELRLYFLSRKSI